MTKTDLLEFMRGHVLAVQSSVTSGARPQAAVVGIVVTNAFEIFFDTIDRTRKAQNLRQNPNVAFVVGGLGHGEERTVQFEGMVDEPAGAELEALKELYFASFPDGRERQRWPGLIYMRARPTWIRYSDFSGAEPVIVEFTADQLNVSG